MTGQYHPLNISTLRSMDKTQLLVPTFDICEMYATRFDSKVHERPISTCPLSLKVVTNEKGEAVGDVLTIIC